MLKEEGEEETLTAENLSRKKKRIDLLLPAASAVWPVESAGYMARSCEKRKGYILAYNHSKMCKDTKFFFIFAQCSLLC